MNSAKTKIIKKLVESEHWIQISSSFYSDEDDLKDDDELEKGIKTLRTLVKKLSEKMESIDKLEKEISSKRFGDYIRYIRKYKNKTLGYVGKKLGISIGYMSQIELGERSPFNDECIKKFCEIFDQDYYFMLGLAVKERRFVRIGENRRLLKTKKPQLPEALLV
jgi:transcriptional regulator with XRE-family HTH domain